LSPKANNIPASPPGENRRVKVYEYNRSLKASNFHCKDVRRFQRRNIYQRLTRRCSPGGEAGLFVAFSDK
jgi:hypothetical protein